MSIISIMSVNDWVGLCVGVTTLISAVAIGVRFLVKHYLSELKPNSGTSMRDEINRQGQSIKRLENRIDDIYRLLIK